MNAEFEVPRKCAICVFLEAHVHHGFHCTKDREKWGDFHRGLDWGAWKPDTIFYLLPGSKITSKLLSKLVIQNDLIGFLKEYRRLNPSVPLNDGREDFVYLKKLMLGDLE
jgi:hypothetical protein